MLAATASSTVTSSPATSSASGIRHRP
jgi:hypothetical protein